MNMFKSLLFRWSPLTNKLIQKDSLRQLLELKRSPLKDCQPHRPISVSLTFCKKRKSVEERAVENQGRKIFRYTKASSEVVGIWRDMTVRDVANVLNKDVEHVLKALEFADKTSDIEYSADTVLRNQQLVRDVVKISGCRFKLVAPPGADGQEEENKDCVRAPPPDPSVLRPRPAVACVMGHVDHGKTTLLDALRHSRVVDQEFGGITQHIGAFEVTLSGGGRVTFLDTPGHAAFGAMRARGAHATDVCVLVVAADDGVMEQTREAIRMANDANVPILVAINKIDKPGVDIDRVLRELAREGVICESLGGEVQAVPVSALTGQGLPALVDALHLQAQLLDLKADYGGPVEGVVIESQLDTKLGKQATVLVQRGTLRRGCVIVAGLGWAKVRVLRTAEGRTLEFAEPSTPAAVVGWRELPRPGDIVIEVPSEKRANEVMKWRHAQRMKEKQEADLEVISAKAAEHRTSYQLQLQRKRAAGRLRVKPEGPRQKMIQDDGHPTLSVIVKGDVDGSVEAILDIVETYDEDHRVRLDLVHFGVGPVTPNDIEIAEAFGAAIYAFNVEVPPTLAVLAKQRGVTVKQHNVVYKLVDDLKREVSDRLPTRQEEELLGEANVLQAFLVSEGKKKLPVAGARCVKGSLVRAALYRLVRNGEVIYEGKLASMKHLKDEVTTIKRDMECGLRLEDPAVEIRPGDTIVCYRMVDVRDSTGWDPGF